MIDGLKSRMRAKSAAVLLSLETKLDRIVVAWLAVAALASIARIATSTLDRPIKADELLPYFLLVVVPVCSIVLALRWFADGDLMAQPEIRLARVGKWRELPASEAMRHRLYGAGGIMVALLSGMLLNVPMRAAEYLAAMPPVPADAPQWLAVLRFAMTLDVILFASLYATAFVAALRRVPLFPRLLVAVWLGDLAMQLIIAKLVTGAAYVPPAVVSALHALLEGNMKKVLISIAIWLPYLLLSTRVNVTYRSRVPA